MKATVGGGAVRRQCAWCGEPLATDSAKFDPNRPISHGICDSCLAAEFGLETRPLGSFLDDLEEPVLLVEADQHIRAGNRRARELHPGGLAPIEQVRVGDVIECVSAAMAGGCGRQDDCIGCELRHAIQETFATGVAHRARVRHQVVAAQGGGLVEIAVTMELADECVLLRIDSLDAVDD